ncbi:hypothetical protein ACFL0U_03345 [Pseudomonadota bacterium]
MKILNRKIFSLILLSFVICFLSLNDSYANLLFSKTYIILDRSNRSEIFQITNLSGKKMRYKAKLLHYKQVENGQYENIENPVEEDMIADKLVYVSPRSFILEPKETQTIRVMRKNYNSGKLKSTPNGEYRSHLLVIEDSEIKDTYDLETVLEDSKYKLKKNEFRIHIHGLMGTSIPLIVRKGELNSSAKITSVQPLVDSKGKPAMRVEIKRSGNKSVRGDIIIKVDGKQVGKTNNFAIYTSTDKRYMNIPLKFSLEDNSKSNIRRIINSLKNKKIEVHYIDIENKKKDILASYTSK